MSLNWTAQNWKERLEINELYQEGKISSVMVEMYHDQVLSLYYSKLVNEFAIANNDNEILWHGKISDIIAAQNNTQKEKCLLNAAKCKRCGQIIRSRYRHDFKRCGCRSIFIDGGNDYQRLGGNPDDMIVLLEIDDLIKYHNHLVTILTHYRDTINSKCGSEEC